MSTHPSTDRRSERHALDAFSLLAGIVFLGLGGAFIVAELGDADVDARWVVAVLLVGLGLAGALSSIARPRRRDAGEEPARDDAADEDPAGTHVPEGA